MPQPNSSVRTYVDARVVRTAVGHCIAHPSNERRRYPGLARAVFVDATNSAHASSNIDLSQDQGSESALGVALRHPPVRLYRRSCAVFASCTASNTCCTFVSSPLLYGINSILL